MESNKINQPNQIFKTSYKETKIIPNTVDDSIYFSQNNNPFDDNKISSKSDLQTNTLNSTQLTLQNKSNELVSGKMILPAGNHKIKILHGKNKDKKVALPTRSPIYFFENQQFAKMEESTNCFVLDTNDFKEIKSLIHGNAFSKFFSYIEDNLVVVWKIPVDIMHIDNLEIPKVPFPVGNYQLLNDYTLESYGKATKLRSDVRIEDKVVSVHTFKRGGKEGSSSEEIPGISTGLLMQDFNEPTEQEEENVKSIIESLAALEIHAYSCNGAHHAIIIDKYNKENITPADFAELLYTTPEICKVISNYAKNSEDIFMWKDAFIRNFRKS